MKKLDGMLIASFLTTIFYSATYPFIHKEIMASVTDTIVASNQIVDCVSIVVLGSLWNKKSGKLFKYYPVFCINQQPVSITFECPYCNYDVTLDWDDLDVPEYWGDDWGEVECPHCKKTVLLGDYDMN